MKECNNISICKFLSAYVEEREYWYRRYCGNVHLAKRCERLKWCSCRGSSKPPVTYQPDGRQHM